MVEDVNNILDETFDESISDADIMEQLNHFENQLTASLVVNFEENRLSMSRLKSDYFRNENYVIYKMLKKVASQKDLGIDVDYLKIFLNAHKYDFALDKDRIEFEAFETDDYSGLDGLIVATVEVFKEYLTPGYLESDSFNDIFVKFKNVYAGLELQDTLQSTSSALYKGIYYKRKRYSGVSGSIEYLKRKMDTLQALTSEEESYSLVDASLDDYDEMDSRTPTLLANLDFIPTLDEAMRGIRTNHLITMVAPEKGMKTKFATRVAHTAMLNGHNVCFWGKEGGSVKVKAELRAIHFDYLHNQVRGNNYSKISSTDIMTGTLDDKIKELEKVSWMDLFKSGKYGKLITPDYPFKFEEMEGVVRLVAERHNCKLVVIDYVQIMDSDTYNDDRIIIEKAYGKLETLKGVLDICIWCPAQMSTDAVQAFGNGQHRELRNVTAKSSEPTKSSDINFLVYVTDEMERKNIAKIYHLPSRTLGSFETIDVVRDPIANNLIEPQGQAIEFVDGEITVKDKE